MCPANFDGRKTGVRNNVESVFTGSQALNRLGLAPSVLQSRPTILVHAALLSPKKAGKRRRTKD